MKAAPWEKVTLSLPQAREVQAVAPVIISASRSTDLPAFHSEWFMNRLRAGHAAWRNPFNQAVQYVSFMRTRVVVFWTKNPAPLLPHLQEIEDMGINYYFQFTINDYETQGWEPNVPRLESRIETMARLSARIGRDRIIWRFDPLLLSDTVTEDVLAKKVQRVGNLAHPYTSKLVFSFADIAAYRKVRTNLASAGINYSEFDTAGMMRMAQRIAEMNHGWGLDLATCAEAENFEKLGIMHNRCIDGELMLRLFPSDSELRRFLNPRQRPLMLGMSDLDSKWQDKIKDAGQRKECGCIVSKDIGAYNTCAHLCTYCYANTSERVVMKNLARRAADEACIVSA
ncbi:hypothetical protein H4684_003292 [Desulfomicrobium macestii]|uniref:DUF1848 domain-containing protein n=1 Tax=Desulfomicrobium macestii TaxID=90731 RepID=A0ABR9H7D3_9BACT|nr:DUF1848 domain-containing protein [Desulfomicrobium macestii]MBE1426626.1 hypothetical protein [Desulfomicrobium macestii]